VTEEFYSCCGTSKSYPHQDAWCQSRGSVADRQKLIAERDEYMSRARTAEHLLRSTGVYDRISEQERIRVARWHATRDAALSGLLVNNSIVGKRNVEIASDYANEIHGPLKAPAK
jgi:hypothetical protein